LHFNLEYNSKECFQAQILKGLY